MTRLTVAELPTSDGRPAIYIIFNVSDFLHICPYAETHRVCTRSAACASKTGVPDIAASKVICLRWRAALQGWRNVRRLFPEVLPLKQAVAATPRLRGLDKAWNLTTDPDPDPYTNQRRLPG